MTHKDGLTAELEKRLAAALKNGERVLYVGRPDWRAGLGRLLIIGGFGLGFSAICLFFVFMTSGAALGWVPFTFEGVAAPRWVAAIFLVPLLAILAIGLCWVIVPLRELFKNTCKAHVVTDRRLLTLCSGRWNETESHPLNAISIFKRSDHGNGRGSFVIVHGVERDLEGNPRPLLLYWSRIPEIDRAQRVIEAAKNPKP